MLVIHWSKQNRTQQILSNGIRPSKRKRSGYIRGVYVYPFSKNRTLSGNWKRNLKSWDHVRGNFNGFVFRLEKEDFPLYAGYWFFNRSNPEDTKVNHLKELEEKYGGFFSGDIVHKTIDGIPINWDDFEIIIPHKITEDRIMKVIRDREPRKEE